MSSPRLSRREAIVFGLAGGTLAGATVTGCDQKEAKKTTAEGMIEIGQVVLAIPHWLGKVIGAALIASGHALKLYFACSDNTQKEVEILLTDEQQRTIREALAAGKTFTVTDPEGNKQTVAAKKPSDAK